jgi:hypothetical protein
MGGTMTTETITLAQALKQRKRLAQRIGQIDQRIGKNNSVPQGNVRDASPRELLAERARLVDQLVAVKMAVLRGNDGIQEKVLRIAEIKGEITLLNVMTLRFMRSRFTRQVSSLISR